MNWTGGSLQRSKNVNKGVVQKQKAHFARARTQLQNGPTTQISPFRPAFFQDEDVGLAGHLPASGARSIRHTGHSRTLKERRSSAQPPHISTKLRARPISPVAQSQPRGRGRDSTIAVEGGISEKPKGKRDATGADAEERLLEARRDRLLQQQDWVGLTQPKPVSMHFPSVEEKGRIGKRRKIADHRLPLDLHKRYPPCLLRDGTGNQLEPYGRVVRQNENIRVRIGTDALTTFTPTQQTPTPSRAAATSLGESSDTMLFDNEDLAIAPVQRVRVERKDTQEPGASVGARMQLHATPRHLRYEREHSCVPIDCDDQAKTSLNQSDGRDEVMDGWSQRERAGKHSPATIGPQNEEITTHCHITQRIGDVDRRLHLVFDRNSNFSASVGDDRAPRGNAIGETTQVHDPVNARLHEKGKELGHSDADRVLAGPAPIVDDEPWRLFLPIADESSSRSMDSASPLTNAPHAPPHQKPFRDRDNEFQPWSQHATLGARTHINSSSCVSDSLPSITRDMEKDTLEARPHDKGVLGGTVETKRRDEGEELWRNIVLGSRDVLESDTIHPKELADEQEEMTAERFASSGAVRSFSSTPFKSVSGLTSCDSYSVQYAAARDPLLQVTSSGSMWPLISSLAARPDAYGRVQRLSLGPLQLSEHGGFGESVTHGSVENNASCDTAAGRLRNSGDLRATRNGLDREEGCRNDRFGPALQAQARRSEYAETSIYDISVSDDDGSLDLVEW